MKDKKKINKFLSLYSRILLAVFGITLILVSIILLSSDAPVCYKEVDQKDVLVNDLSSKVDIESDDGCLLVEDIDSVEKKYNTYKWVSIICFAGIFVFNDRKGGQKR